MGILAVCLAFDTWGGFSGDLCMGQGKGGLQARQCGLPRSHCSGHDVSRGTDGVSGFGSAVQPETQFRGCNGRGMK